MVSQKISIVTPSFNQGHFLEQTICSVLDQKYDNLEYIVIDGGSTDNSVEIIKKYQRYVHYWVSEKDKGHAHALNKGFKKSTGDILGWINSDDIQFPWTLKTVASVFKDLPSVNWIQGNPALWDSDGILINADQHQKNLLDYILGNYRWIQQESTFWRRSLWEKSGCSIDESYKYMIDGELWSRFFLHDELYRLNRVIGGFRKHETNRSSENYSECIREMEQIIAKLKKQVIGSKIPDSHYSIMKFYCGLPLLLKRRKIFNFLTSRFRKFYDYKYIEKSNNKWSVLTSKYFID